MLRAEGRVRTRIRAVCRSVPLGSITHPIASPASSRSIPPKPSACGHSHLPAHHAILRSIAERIWRHLGRHRWRHPRRQARHRSEPTRWPLRHRIVAVPRLRRRVWLRARIVMVRLDRSADPSRPSLHRRRLLRHVRPVRTVLLQSLSVLFVQLLLIRRRRRMILPRRHFMRRLHAEVGLLCQGNFYPAPEPRVF